MGISLIHNCDETGKLLDFKSVQEFKDSCKSLWLNMKLLIFKKDHGEFPVWRGPECPSMRGVSSMGVQHNEEDLLQYICVHSRTASFLVPDWQTIWNVRGRLHYVYFRVDSLLKFQPKCLYHLLYT